MLMSSAELSLTVPIVNTLAFLFTVLGEWYVEGKVIGRGQFSPAPRVALHVLTAATETGIGMALSLVGIALCVHSKT